MLNDGKYGCGGVWCVILFACLHLLAGCVSADGDKDDSALAQSRVLRAQRLRNMTPGDEILPELRAIVDSMRRDGRDVYYYAAVNVLVDQLFSANSFVEADSTAARMLADAIADRDSTAMAIAARVRGQMLYKLFQPEKSLAELRKARSYITSRTNDMRVFSTSASVDEWIWMAARAAGDTASYVNAASGYARTVSEMGLSGWTDSTAHFPVTALAFEASKAMAEGDSGGARSCLLKAGEMMLPQYPARAYEHYYEVKGELDAASGNYAEAIACIDTLVAAHRDFPWFRLYDIKTKARLLEKAGRHKEGMDVYSEYVVMHDSLLASQVDLRLKDLTVLYRSEINREQRRAHSFKVQGLAGAAVLLTVLLVWAFMSAKRERRKNKILVERLREIDRISVAAVSPAVEQATSCDDIDNIDSYMAAGRPYTDPAFNRRELAVAVGMNPERLASIVKESRGMSVLAYINAWRLEEARKALEKDTHENIADMAARLGFGTARTLQRVFRDRFGMSPSQYRDLARCNKCLD